MRIVMMGTGIFAEPTLEALLARTGLVVGLFTQPDRAVGQERGSTRQTGRGMKTIAQEHGVSVFQPDSVNTPEGVAMLRSAAPDLLVVAAYGQILSAEVLSVPKHGGINVHASLLPKYRGAAPIAWAIYHGETRTGVTIIRMSTGLDAGDMLAQEAIDIGPEQTAGDVEAVLAPLGARLALAVVDQIMAGTPPQGVKQDKSLITKAPKLTKENGIIDWTRPADRVCCQVRAMHPWPTAYTFWHRAGQPSLRLIIHRATSRVESNPSPQPPPRSGEGENDKNPSPQPPPRSGEGETQRSLLGGEAISEALFLPLSASGRGLGGGVSSLSPGTVLPVSATNLCVAAGENTIVEIHELQPAGKKRMTAAEFLRGRKPQSGDRLGPEEP
jgi:methionyl-tRNA formyltransferase